MDFSFPTKITEDFILSNVSELQIFNYYFQENINPKKLYVSKIRKDHTVTVGFYINKSGKLTYHDFATGEFYNCFNYVMQLYNINYYQALKKIAEDFNLIKTTKYNSSPIKIVKEDFNKDKAIIQVEVQDFTESELKWWSKFGITPEILKHFNVYSCKTVFLNGQVIAMTQQHCPIFGYYGGKYQGIELWKIYFPKRKLYRFLGNYPSEKLQCYNKLPKKGKICVITKSQKDCMSLYAFGIPACAPNSETVMPKESIIKDLTNRFEQVFCLWDNDYTGVTFLNKIKKKYPELKCLIIPRHLGAKDFSDLYKKYGKDKTLNLIKEYLLWLKGSS